MYEMCTYRVLGGNSLRKRLLGRKGRRWEDTIKMNVREISDGY
jgi:hypothetical protein